MTLLPRLISLLVNEGNEMKVGCSAGGAVSYSPFQGAAKVMEIADRALHRAKQSGKNRVHFDA